MAITNASRLADFGSGIGTEGAIIQVDNTNARLGIGTTNPQAMLQVGTGVTVYGNSGIVSATSFYGDGSELTGITAGATLSAGSGAQRVVVTSLTSGTMTTAATDAELSYNSGTNTLGVTSVSATNLTGALVGNVTGNVTGNASGTAGGLTGTPDIAVRNITGVAATFTGVLTYEDVTNVDSVGIVTAGGGLYVGRTSIGATIDTTGNAVFAGILTASSFSGVESWNQQDTWLYGSG